MPQSYLRQELVERIEQDLVGPYEVDEILQDRPTDVYLTGILYPEGSQVSRQEEESLESEGKGAEKESYDEGVSLVSQKKPSSMGLSFAIEVRGESASLDVEVSGSQYRLKKAAEDQSLSDDPDERGLGSRRAIEWQRIPFKYKRAGLVVDSQRTELLKDEDGPEVKLYLRAVKLSSGVWLVTAAVSNEETVESGAGRAAWEERCIFQSELRVSPGNSKVRFVRRPIAREGGSDEDARMAALLYRKTDEFAVGHTCSASWSVTGEPTDCVQTSWIPVAKVSAVSSSGHPLLMSRVDGGTESLQARSLAVSSKKSVIETLESLRQGYLEWIDSKKGESEEVAPELTEQANRHLERAHMVADRMRKGIDLLCDDPNAMLAFQLSNYAMSVQWEWQGNEKKLSWRPFQIGFIMLALESLANGESGDRTIADLLWFPTGGGKTEAYLALISFLIFYRRLQYGHEGGGVAAIMRYTLRLLTTQQFERAAGVICACEAIRIRGVSVPDDLSEAVGRLGGERFSIGLWVGKGSTPNDPREARKQLRARDGSTPRQITRCPWHPKDGVDWTVDGAAETARVFCTCRNETCPWNSGQSPVPVWTVDTDVYRERPTFIIGTVDKFAQVIRSEDTRRILGSDGQFRPPELVVQDELHLISGPLGTMTGLYECGLDIILSRNGVPSKLIASTATIRRADEQIKALFNRDTELFPAPGIEASDSGFAVVDDEAPGRLYVGLSTVGRSAKFALQSISATLLQAASANDDKPDLIDPYWTLVAYFNSLRELGGGLVLFQDDVNSTMEELAQRRQEDKRSCRRVKEITSRVGSSELRGILDEMELSCSSGKALDVTLATNMISVGVDVSRLGVMVVNGQPKTMAEYIQATSRVGRGNVPGIVVTVYNNGKSRDRSRYESFASWHQAIYRDVEATSVTPFSPRARDRALHAALVAAVRHLVPGMVSSPELRGEDLADVERYVDLIVERAERIDPAEAAHVRKELEWFIDNWRRPGIREYWNDEKRQSSLLISAEKAAVLGAMQRPIGDARPTPNSMRNVEASVGYRLKPKLRDRSNG